MVIYGAPSQGSPGRLQKQIRTYISKRTHATHTHTHIHAHTHTHTREHTHTYTTPPTHPPKHTYTYTHRKNTSIVVMGLMETEERK